MLRIVPNTGTRLKKLIATGKKPLNSKKNPYDSITMPISGQPSNTTNIPPKKAIDALAL